MYDLPPDLPRLRTLEQQLTIWIGHVRAAITAAEQQEDGRRSDGRPPRTGSWSSA
ncbi:hypothetical protein ACIPJO_34190 [Streptomyces sp. NPDC086993]|uniref:hypothetical protein n=1 Tax=unclassified Streptomyces TaxID=2593676 RepID=UPI0038164DB9